MNMRDSIRESLSVSGGLEIYDKQAAGDFLHWRERCPSGASGAPERGICSGKTWHGSGAGGKVIAH